MDPLLAGACGSLDCHGAPHRPLRLFGWKGLRVPGAISGEPPTRRDEVELNFRAIVGLEPEALGRVVASRGDGVERLTIVRKASGEEVHRGGAPFPVESAADACLVLWLSGRDARRACERAVHEASAPAPSRAGPGDDSTKR